MAAGLEIEAAGLDAFRAATWSSTRVAALTPEDLVKVEHVDAVVPGDALGAASWRRSSRLCDPSAWATPA